MESKPKAAEATSKDYYFDSYGHFAIHEEMLKDEVRTGSYLAAIDNNRHLFEGKVVMDIGCGTGILSLFAARAGAKRVIAIECSSIIEQARQIMEANREFGDKVTLIQSKCEEIDALPDGLEEEGVDIIISEWMGYFLLYESMLDTVIYARDRWLKKGGRILPDKAVLYMGAIEDGDYKKEKIEFWDDVYGFDMSAIKELALMEPLVDTVDSRAVVSEFTPLLEIDILTCSKQDLTFSSEFSIRMRRNDNVHGLVAYFDVAFTNLSHPAVISTSPFTQYTHWKQTIFYLRDALRVRAGDVLEGQISVRPNAKNERDLDISMQLDFDGAEGKLHTLREYRLR